VNFKRDYLGSGYSSCRYKISSQEKSAIKEYKILQELQKKSYSSHRQQRMAFLAKKIH
jgi:hypothetical protein